MTIKLFILSALAIGAFTIAATGQTSVFSYQGRLTDGAGAANGTYQMQFSLFSLSTGGSQIGTTITNNSVAVLNGTFTVPLDFTATLFAAGADRWLEIAVKKPADPGFTTLSPRQRITSAPYAVRSASAASADTATNAANLNSLPASSYVLTSDPRMTDARSPTPGSDNYIQNQVLVQQVGNFNIDGNAYLGGTLSANTVNTQTQYNIGGSRAFTTAGTFNVMAGVNTGLGGSNNSFFGNFAGLSNTTGFNNTMVGYNANPASNNLVYATAIGANSVVSTSNTLVLGRPADTVQVPGTLTGNGSGLTGVITIAAFAGDINAITGNATDYVFAGPTAQVTIAAGQRLTGSASAPLGRLVAESADVRIGLCYQSTVPASTIINFVGGNYMAVPVSTVRQIFSAAASAAPGAGTFNVGFCVLNGSPTSIDNNDFVNGWIMITR